MEGRRLSEKLIKPDTIPRSTYWPFILAVSLLFILWGMISYWILSITGAIGFFIALGGWIKEMIYEQQSREGR